MKINRVLQDKRKKSSRKDGIFLNIYYFFLFYRYIFLLIIGIAISAFIFLLVVDFIAPKTLKNLDTKATLELFNQLQEANRHQEAIILMEYKGDIINGTPLELEYKSKLSDSYIHVGDYSKAEKMLLDVWNNSQKYLAEFLGNEKTEYRKQVNFLKLGVARTIYQFYEKIGDKKNQIKFYHLYKQCYDHCEMNVDSLAAATYNTQTWFSKKSTFNIKELIEYDSIVVMYETDTQKAIYAMGDFVDKIIDRKEYSPAFKVKCLNKLIGWMLDKNKLIDAYPRIAQAVEQVKLMKVSNEYVGLGELSDYCYKIHDVELSKSLFNRYQDYLDDNYQRDDFDYLSNYVRGFRYLEEEKKWDELGSKVIDYCEGMRKQIALNIPTMTEEQREFFAKQFDVAYYYAFDLLEKHPSDEIAALCFDNITFKSGLLLRSNLSLRHSIENLNDPDAMKMYNELYDLRREMIFESVSGNKIFNRKDELSERISEIEKNLAIKSTDFKTKNQLVEYKYSDIREKLTDKDALVDLVENKGHLFALILLSEGRVKYVPIGNINEITSNLRQPIYKVYHDVDLTKFLWAKIEAQVKECTNIYYMPVGAFNQLALGSLYIGDNLYLGDSKNLKLLSNPSLIIDGIPSVSLSSVHGTALVSLWGGINYGGNVKDIISDKLTRHAIKRGETLTNLRYAYNEVMDISSMLNVEHVNNLTFTYNQATERAFKNRSGKKDYIIHVSTHGFFDDSADRRNSMLRSGLFFAGANRYWVNDSIEVKPNQEDGILRAAEIATLDLSGCSLAVLSACETGLGFNDSSEGVYGLQRAFKLAGANLILMSLWDVDDRATNLLMTEFYRHLLLNEDADKALWESQKVVRMKYPSPEDWGGFVLLH